MNDSKKDLVVIPCPPHSEYETQPDDQSHCELFVCPKCKSKMWLSQKKKGIIMFASVLDKDILLACYPCMRRIIEDDSSIISDSEMVNI
jgi:uncharacterized protein YbaR (Trm112 family)